LNKDIGSGSEVNWFVSGRACQRLPSVDLRMVIRPAASSSQNNMAAVSAEGSTVWVLIRRLNSSRSRSIALPANADGVS